MHGTARSRLSLAALVLGALLALGAALPAEPTRAASTPSVSPVGSRPHGKTCGDWAALWAQWFFRVPLHVDANDPGKGILNPNFETTGATRGVSQSGPVFFLANLHPLTDGAARRCTVPAGKALLLPLAMGVCLNLPGEHRSVDDLRFECRTSLDAVTEASVEIDGVPVPGVMNVRGQSRPFSCRGLAALGVMPRPYWPATVDGYVVLVQPLPAGEHTIRYREHSPLVGPPIEAAYTLTVVARR